MESITNDPVIQMLHRALNIASRRQQMTAANIANLDTPGYLTRDIDFRETLRLAAAGAPDVQVQEAMRHDLVEGLRVGNDGNNVDIDREMLNLAQGSGFYSAAIGLMRRQAALMRYAISEGRS